MFIDLERSINMKTFVVRSYAKINICLDITGKRENGYHELDMVMVPLELHDTLLITDTPRAVDNYVTLDDFTIADSEFNTVSKAIEYLNQIHPLNTKFKIDLHKVIPMKAGLGGGSSNAAFTLKSICNYKKIDMNSEELRKIAVKIGADVPFFIENQPSRCLGIGDELRPINIKNDYYVLLVKPEAGCSTKEIFDLSDKEKNWPHGNVEQVVKALEDGDDELLASSIFNVLESPSIKLVPEINKIKNDLKELGFKIVMMTGSGSAVFALSTDKKMIKKTARQLEDKYQTVIVTKVLK